MEHFGTWSILTTNFLFVLYLALGGIIFSSLLHLANGKWRFQVRDLACAFSALFPVAGVLLLILLANGSSTFTWVGHDPTKHDPYMHLNGWHSYGFLVARQVAGFVLVWWLCRLFVKYQALASAEGATEAVRWRFRNIALLIPFAYVIYGTLVAWDFEMTQWPGWHSASYGAYFFQSNFHMFLGFFTVILYMLSRSGRLARGIEPYIMNYMAQFMLAMTILWTYLYFTQYLIMWYGRLPWDMHRYNQMMFQGLGVLWWTFLTLKFIIPFTTLAITPNRHNPPVIAAVGLSIVVGTWIERYTWIVGSTQPEYYHIPFSSLLDLVYFAAVAGVAWYVAKRALERQGLVKA
ncbi:MAG: polysulfide reductase, NrfD [Gammaproteobacteria bacterium]|nr:MAG: polysulfide reductase, NrfD [Gammaproteobacteria bacterium]